MWRYLVGGGAALVLVLAGMFLFRGTAASEVRAPPPSAQQSAAAADAPLPEEAPSADARTREQKRFDRLDKDRNQAISRDEFFAQRKRLFTRMDANHDGKLAFEEWAFRGIERFASVDKDKSGALDRTEFAATAPKRRPPRPGCRCDGPMRPNGPPPGVRPMPPGAHALPPGAHPSMQEPMADGEEE